MPNRLHRLIACSVLLIATLATAMAATDRRPITEEDLLAFVWVADPQISPDGSRVAFVRVRVDTERDQYESAIWLVSTDGRQPPRELTVGPRDLSPRWSPDGSRLVFLRSVEREGRTQPQLHVMSLAGGEPRALLHMPRGAANPVWSPDGSTIAFSSTSHPDELTAEAERDSRKARRESDVRVITEARYRANGVAGFGYVERERPSHIWTVAAADSPQGGPVPRRLTAGEFGANNHQWTPDGSEILFTSDRRREPYYLQDDEDVYGVAKDGGEPRLVASIDGRIGAFSISPDRRRLAFIGAANGKPERSYDQPDLWVVDLPGGTPRNLTASYDFDIGGGLAGDQRAPRGQHPIAPLWLGGASDAVVVRVGEHGYSRLTAFHIDGREKYAGHTAPADEEVLSYTVDARGSRIAAVVSSSTRIGDLVVYDGVTGAAPARLTSFNDGLFGRLSLTEPEEIWYSSFDGRKIQGWILKPPGFDPSKKHPLILQIHGGPHAAYGHAFTHEFHLMAARGYVVLYTNPRGSSNYGQEFGNIIQFTYPGDDYKDLMAGVDAVIKEGYIDENRMGVTGGSGGGLLTNWVVTQTNRFKAAVSQRDISDWTTFWYTADFTLFTPSWFRKAPFEDAAEFTRRSPITHAARIQTPLMFILGDEDWRTPPSAGGEQLFRALKYLKRPTVMVRFPNENHELSRSGKPWHRIERLQHILGWFDKYVLGKEVTTYDGPR